MDLTVSDLAVLARRVNVHMSFSHERGEVGVFVGVRNVSLLLLVVSCGKCDGSVWVSCLLS